MWYTAQRDVDLGLDFLEAVDEALDADCEQPQRFPKSWKGTRRVLLRRFPYQLFFYEVDEGIVVTSVLHSARDPTGIGKPDRS